MVVIDFFRDLFMMKYVPQLGMNASYGLLFLVGLLTSFHCVGMCGGIVLSQTAGKSRNEPLEEQQPKYAWVIPSLLYNLGRVLAYTLVGAIAGGLGQVIGFTGIWKGVVPIVGGLFMVIMGINLLGVIPALRRFNIRMPYFAARKIREMNHKSPFFIGMLTGLMPCGPLQIVQLYALGTGSYLLGASSMFVFSLGTIPALFALGAIHSFVGKKLADRILKVSAVFVIVLGVVMLGRGFALSGIQLDTAARAHINIPDDAGIARIENGIQVVGTSIKADSYPPILVQKGLPVRWTLHADAENLNECNHAIRIPGLDMERELLEGDNLIEFTPLETGNMTYTCWMGMIKSRIIVVDNLVEAEARQKEQVGK